MKELEPILKYKMNELEAKAYKIALIWEDECSKEIKNEQFVKIKRNSDPRKSTLFKYCYKLAKETKGIIEDKEIPFYIKAQIQILKSINQGQIHALIEPHCLVGEKAWRRWKFWKNIYLKKIKKISTSEDIGVFSKKSKIKAELFSTFEFLKNKECFNFDEFEKNKENIKSWILSGQISYFYIILSPWMKKVFQNYDFNFDQVYFRSSITPCIESFFKEIFNHEYI